MARPLHLLIVFAGAPAIALSLAAATGTRAAQDARAEKHVPQSAAATTLAVALPAGRGPVVAPPPTGGAGQAPASEEAGDPAGARDPKAAGPRPDRPLMARVSRGKRVLVRTAPGGRVVARYTSKTEFGSRRTLSVVARRGKWLGVVTTARPNNRLGWIHSERAKVKLLRPKVTLTADLSRRLVSLRVGDEVVRRVRVSVGRPGSSTPTGTFAVTDKLDGRRFSPYYGCCILALSGTQPNLPAGWQGGNRLAIHGTNATPGRASSAGCLHAAARDLRALMRRVPVGTTITIHR